MGTPARLGAHWGRASGRLRGSLQCPPGCTAPSLVLRSWRMGVAAATLVVLLALSRLDAAVLPVAEGALPSLAPMLEQATPAVVNISARTTVMRHPSPLLRDPVFRYFFDLPGQPRERRSQSLGSGVVIDQQLGYVVTNYHVIENAQEITVTLRDGGRLSAILVGVDPETDVAVIKVPPEALTALPFADSDALQVGDFVVAIGNPFGLGQTVTSGIVSALGRTGLGLEGYEDFIQTDASINPGNSGGALVNLRGELVGINTAILAPSGGNVGIGFAIPANMVRQVVDPIIRYGEVRRGELGVTVHDLSPALAATFDLPVRQGAVVVEVTRGSPADEVGVKPGDIVVAVNGREVHTAAEVRTGVGLLDIGQEVDLEILRAGKPQTLRAHIAEPAHGEVAGDGLHPHLAGALFMPALSNGEDRGAGVLVGAVVEGSPAWESGLRGGDQVTQVNRQPVQDLGGFVHMVQANPHGLTLQMRRGASSVYILIQ